MYREEIMDRSKDRDEISYGIVTVFSVMVFLVLMSLLTGKGITDDNAYNTYALQADSWRQVGFGAELSVAGAGSL